jgi:hypothetical protein
MHRFGVRVCFAIFFGIFAGCSFAQNAADNQDLTADELAVNASSLYAQGKYAEAAKLYRVRRGLRVGCRGPSDRPADAISAGIRFQWFESTPAHYSVKLINTGSTGILLKITMSHGDSQKGTKKALKLALIGTTVNGHESKTGA